ncbi:MAG: hypothetical protein RR140_02140 [Clostridia bacterium]
MKRSRLVIATCALTFAIIALTYGVIAATSLTFNISAQISFVATEAFGDVKVGISNAYRKTASNTYIEVGASTAKNTAIWLSWQNQSGGASLGTNITGSATANVKGVVAGGAWTFPAVASSVQEGLYFNPNADSTSNATIVVHFEILNNSASGPVIFYQPTQLMGGGGAKFSAEMFIVKTATAGQKLTPSGDGYYYTIATGATPHIIVAYTPLSLGASFGEASNTITLGPIVRLKKGETDSALASQANFTPKVQDCIADMVSL